MRSIFHLFILNCKIAGRHLKRVFQVIYNNYEIIFDGSILELLQQKHVIAINWNE